MTDQILAAGERAGWREIEEAQQVRLTGGVPPEQQVELAVFLASEQSNHITGRLLDVQDPWKKLKDKTVNPELYTLRRVQRASIFDAYLGLGGYFSIDFFTISSSFFSTLCASLFSTRAMARQTRDRVLGSRKSRTSVPSVKGTLTTRVP